MQIQNSNYIPVRHLPDRPLTHEEKEITKEIIQNNKQIIQNNKQIIQNNKQQQSIIKQMISNNEKMLALKPIFENGLAQLKAQQAESSKSNNLASELSNANNAYVAANKVSSAIKQIEHVEAKSTDPVNQREVLTQADFILDLGDYRGALKGYDQILSDRENKPVPDNYRPVEEKLRQASKLYMEFQPLIEKLDINSALKTKLYCAGIAAHTTGMFNISKAEALHMIKNQFYYPNLNLV